MIFRQTLNTLKQTFIRENREEERRFYTGTMGTSQVVGLGV
jgi:hypothetical protein